MQLKQVKRWLLGLQEVRLFAVLAVVFRAIRNKALNPKSVIWRACCDICSFISLVC